MRQRGAASIYVVLSGASALCYRMIFVVEVFYVAGGLFLVLSSTLALVMPDRQLTPAQRAERTTWQQRGYTG